MDVNKEIKIICSEIFRLLPDDYLLKEVKDEIRKALQLDEDECEKFAQWWSLASKGKQKAFVHLLDQYDGDWSDACNVATGAKGTGVASYRTMFPRLTKILGVILPTSTASSNV